MAFKGQFLGTKLAFAANFDPATDHIPRTEVEKQMNRACTITFGLPKVDFLVLDDDIKDCSYMLKFAPGTTEKYDAEQIVEFLRRFLFLLQECVYDQIGHPYGQVAYYDHHGIMHIINVGKKIQLISTTDDEMKTKEFPWLVGEVAKGVHDSE